MEKTEPSAPVEEHVEASLSADGTEKNVTNADAQQAALTEHDLTLKDAFKKCPKAVFWSVMVSTSIIMEGYDIVLVTSLFAQPAFSERFGQPTSNGQYTVAGAWQSALSAAPTIGAIFGAFLNGWVTTRFGFRRVLLVSLVAITAFIFLIFFATNPGMLLAGLILCGIPWGGFATMAPAYASEVCPLALRGHLAMYVNLCWALGQLIAAGVLEGFVDRLDQWAYRIPFGIQWAWPIPLFAILWFAPESPWWLARNGRIDESLHAITRLSNTNRTAAKQTIAMIMHTLEIEDAEETGTSYWDCFKGVDLRRTEVVCMAFASQIWCGSPLGGTPSYFFLQAGLDASTSFKFSVGGLGLASVGTMVAWFLLSYFGRRTLYVWGLGMLAFILLIVGIVASVSSSTASTFTQASFVLIWLAAYYLTVGPVCYAIIAETPASSLRNKSICLSRIAYYISQVVGNVIYPYMVNPLEANWQGKAGYFWAGTCVIFFVWSFFRLPETRNRTYEELDILFAGKVRSREFPDYIVRAYAGPGEERLIKR